MTVLSTRHRHGLVPARAPLECPECLVIVHVHAYAPCVDDVQGSVCDWKPDAEGMMQVQHGAQYVVPPPPF
jgi:hypothetical protein